MKETFQGTLDVCLTWDKSEEHTLIFAPDSQGSVYIQIAGEAMQLSINLIAQENCQVHVWFDVRTQISLQDQIHVHAHRYANIHVSLLDIEAIAAKHALCGDFDSPDAQIEFHTATLAAADKCWRMEILHEHPRTSGLMENYCVVEEGAACDIEAIGNIKKGAHDSVSHQKSRVLTMSKKHDAQVTPILYIDENAVKASHAMTIGQPDAEQLYYLQTRGLNKEMALGLLSIGYFLPIVEQIANSTRREEIKCRVEEKVGLYGHREHS